MSETLGHQAIAKLINMHAGDVFTRSASGASSHALTALPSNVRTRRPGVASYVLRRGVFSYFLVQWNEGVFKFLFDPPQSVDFTTVVNMESTVAFADTDYNRHFTVSEIVKKSELAMYRLINRSGARHIEHHFNIGFFASNLDCKFVKEISISEGYKMKAQYVSVTG